MVIIFNIYLSFIWNQKIITIYFIKFIKNKSNLNEGFRFIEEPPYLSQLNSKQKSVDLQSVNIYTCNAIKNNLLSNVNPKYIIKEVVINNNNKSLCKSDDANWIQYILEIN